MGIRFSRAGTESFFSGLDVKLHRIDDRQRLLQVRERHVFHKDVLSRFMLSYSGTYAHRSGGEQ